MVLLYFRTEDGRVANSFLELPEITEHTIANHARNDAEFILGSAQTAIKEWRDQYYHRSKKIIDSVWWVDVRSKKRNLLIPNIES